MDSSVRGNLSLIPPSGSSERLLWEKRLTKRRFFCSSIGVSLLRLVVRTQGFHPCNTGSTPVGDVARKGTFSGFFSMFPLVYSIRSWLSDLKPRFDLAGWISKVVCIFNGQHTVRGFLCVGLLRLSCACLYLWDSMVKMCDVTKVPFKRAR